MENFSNKSNEDFQLKFSIDKWEREKVPNSDKSIIKYHVDIVSDISNNKWTVTRTLENFKTVINDLNFICLNIATPPKIFGLKESTQTLTKIGKDFENYLKLLLNRADVINSQIIAEFFELNKHFEKLNQFVPNIKYQIPDLKLQVTEMYYEKENQLLFVGCGKKFKKNFLEKNSVFSKISGFFKKSNEGEIRVYKTDKNNSILLFSLETKSEVSHILYLNSPLLSSKVVIIGYFDGVIDVFELNYMKEQVVISTSLLKKKSTIFVSEKKRRILSTGMNFSTKNIYCACEKDSEISVCFWESDKKTKSIQASDEYLCGFAYDHKTNKYTNRYISIDEAGKIMVGVIDEENSIINLKCVVINQLTKISVFKVDYELNRIIIGDYYGHCNMYSIDDKTNDNQITLCNYFNMSLQKEENKGINQIVGISFPYEVRDAIYNQKKKELYILLKNGIIQVFSHSLSYAECSIENNEECLNKICMNDDFTTMFCGGVSKQLNLINIPKYYLSEMTRRNQEENINYIFNMNDEPCVDELTKGFPKTTDKLAQRKESFIKVNSILDNMIKNDDDEDDEHYPGFVSMKF